jgi:GTP-binding protein
VVDVPDEHVGTVTQAVAPRKGKVLDCAPGDTGRTIVTLDRPLPRSARVPLAADDATRGTALVHQHHEGWIPWVGELPHRTAGR